MSDIVSEIKSRLNIEDVVSQYVQLKKSGTNLKGLCPFHQEKTPSFMVSPEKELAYCFGCHKGGDMIAFIEEVEGVDFKEAVKILADKCGLDPADFQFSEKSKHTKSEKDELIEIHNKTADFYIDYLWNSEKGKKVLGYLHNRGMTDESIKMFKIGLSPDSFDKTYMLLVKKGYSRKKIVLSGIAIAKDTQNERIYDRFRMRLMFPIFNSLGRIVAFGGRALKKEDNPKYLNSPDSPIYKKSEILYGFNFAKDSIKKKEEILLTEGYFDVIMSYQEDVKYVVATSGTALTEKQIKLIKRFTNKLLFCFDTDQAGIAAAKRGFELAQNGSLSVDVITGVSTKDPADYIRDNPGKWKEIVSKKVPFMEFCINDLVKRYDRKTVDGKKKILKDIMPFLSILKSSVEKDIYIRELSQKIDTKEVFLYDELKNKTKIKHPNVRTNDKSQPIGKKLTLVDLIFGLIYKCPDLLLKQFENIHLNIFDDNEKSIYNTYKDNYNLLREKDTRKEFLLCSNDEFRRKLELISLYVDDVYESFSEEMIEKEFETLINKLSLKSTERKKRDLYIQIKEAESKGDKENSKKLLEKFNKLVTS